MAAISGVRSWRKIIFGISRHGGWRGVRRNVE